MIVRGNYTRQVAGAKASLRYYLSRQRGPEEPARGLWGKDGPLTRQEAYALLDRYQDRGVAAHRLILSPAADARSADLRAMTRHVLRELEKDKGQELHWVAVEHRNTDNPHVHVLLCGTGERDGQLRQVRLERCDYGRLREEGREHCRVQEREHDYLARALDRAVQAEGPWRGEERDGRLAARGVADRWEAARATPADLGELVDRAEARYLADLRALATERDGRPQDRDRADRDR